MTKAHEMEARMYDSSLYWSESQKQFVPVADMPLPYAKNVYAKLLREDPNFAGSALQRALVDRLIPSRVVAKTLLATKGECAYYSPPSAQQSVRVRRFFYSIGKALGVKVTTERKGDFIHATCEPVGEEVIVNILHKKDSSKTFIGKGR